MMRDLTMIFSVLVAVVSLGFGVYKNIEAGNARGFAYEQSYRVMDAVQGAAISAPAKAEIINSALDAVAKPKPVLDLSRSSADVGSPAGKCPIEQTSLCARLAVDLGEANVTCAKAKDGACSPAVKLKRDIVANKCVSCF